MPDSGQNIRFESIHAKRQSSLQSADEFPIIFGTPRRQPCRGESAHELPIIFGASKQDTDDVVLHTSEACLPRQEGSLSVRSSPTPSAPGTEEFEPRFTGFGYTDDTDDFVFHTSETFLSVHHKEEQPSPRTAAAFVGFGGKEGGPSPRTAAAFVGFGGKEHRSEVAGPATVRSFGGRGAHAVVSRSAGNEMGGFEISKIGSGGLVAPEGGTFRGDGRGSAPRSSQGSTPRCEASRGCLPNLGHWALQNSGDSLCQALRPAIHSNTVREVRSRV